MNLHQFHRQFEDTNKKEKFQVIDTPIEPTSLFVIFKQLTEVRAQRRYFEEREAHLLALAEIGFQQLKGKKE